MSRVGIAQSDRTYVAPTSIEDAVEALAVGSRVVAGGTDLVVAARRGGTPLPERLVDISRLEALRAIEAVDGGGLRLGPLVRHQELAGDPTIRQHYSALADASAIVGSPATRWVGTIGGNVMSASPGAATIGPLLCFDAVAALASTAGTRTLPVAELISGPGHTNARDDELLTALELAPVADGSGSCYVRLGIRRQMEGALAGAAVLVRLVDGRIADARVAMVAVAPTIRRVPEAEAELTGSAGDEDAIEAAAAAVQAASQPVADFRASAAYRAEIARVVCKRVIRAAIARASGSQVRIPASLELLGTAPRQGDR